MTQTIIDNIIQNMLPHLNSIQLKKLKEILSNELFNKRVDKINKTGKRPEQDIKTTHIDNVKKELQNAEQKFIKKKNKKEVKIVI